MNKIKQFIKNNWFIGITAFNTYNFVTTFLVLLTPAATPMTAFAAVALGAISLVGWLSISYDYSMNKFRKAQAINVVELPKNKKA